MKAIACELPTEHGLPLSRFSRAELHRLVVERGVSDVSATTIARWRNLVLVHLPLHASWLNFRALFTRPEGRGKPVSVTA